MLGINTQEDDTFTDDLLFTKGYLIKENYRKHFSVFLSSHRNTYGSLRENRNCVERLALRACVRTQIFLSRKLPPNTENVMFCIS